MKKIELLLFFLMVFTLIAAVNATVQSTCSEPIRQNCPDGSLELGSDPSGCPAYFCRCVDSDKGRDYEMGGMTTVCNTPEGANYRGDCTTQQDYCSGQTLTEFYCSNGQRITENYICPHGCTSGGCMPVPVSGVKLISPNGGETLTKGQSYTISWTNGYTLISDATRGVSLMLVKEDGVTQVGWINFGGSPTGSYSWNPAKMSSSIYYTNNQEVPDGTYKIRAIDYNDPWETGTGYDLSDSIFTIKSQATCTDLDDGQNFNTKGYITYTNNPQRILTESDICDSNSVVVERICVDPYDNSKNFVEYTCPGGCLDGACVITSGYTQCSDSDGGKNYFAKGNMKWTLDNKVYTDNDFCIIKGQLSRSTECSGPECKLAEMYCINALPQTEEYNCAYGCKDGACIKEIPPICGNGICELKEQCIPSNCDNEKCTDDCGQYYCPQDCQTPPPQIKITVPSEFSLATKESVFVTNYQEMKITLDGISVEQRLCKVGQICPDYPSRQIAALSISTPGGCGPNSDSRCLGSPASYSKKYIALGEYAEALGVRITFTSGSDSRGKFKIELIPPSCKTQDQTCDGIAGISCCEGLSCKLDGNYADASGTCVKEATKYDLGNYPIPFVKESKSDVVIIIGETASTSHVIAGRELALSIDRISGDVNDVNSLIVLDSEAIKWFKSDSNLPHNIISIGPSCVNTVTSLMLGNPENCIEEVTKGKGTLNMYFYKGKSVLLVSGYSDSELNSALSILSNYDKYTMQGDKCEITTTATNGLIVECNGKIPACKKEGSTCGGIAGSPCCKGYSCEYNRLDGNNDDRNGRESYPDQSGVCVKNTNGKSCTDTDDGKKYYIKGNIKSCDYKTKEEPGSKTPIGCSLSTDLCEDEFNLFEYFCNGNRATAEKYACKNGCKDGACIQDTATDCTNGCSWQESCINYGTRLLEGNNAKFCDITKKLTEQKRDDSSCQNNYECLSNSCINAKCGNLEQDIKDTKNMVQKIMEWIKNIFGNR
jgi:hypothetical protein